MTMGTDVDQEMLAEAEMAESELARLGLGHVRVTAYGDLACLDVPRDEIGAISGDPLRAEVLRAVRGAGFDRVAVLIDVV